MKNLSIIACISQDNGIGKEGQLIWKIPADMKFFRETTTGGIVVMGRKTYESIGRPLPKRQNVVLTRQNLSDDNITCFDNYDKLCAYLTEQNQPIYIIGGASLYQMFIEQAEKLYLTEVNSTKPADTFFPNFDRSQFSRRVIGSGMQGDVVYNIVEYTRKV